ncbi:hypothetical protein KCTC52924_03920 [Arenibacter antarcticus]|uniref:Uncharacterized protein n=1 Tax=Arenibacter antarcticus TaxID=2040469 RepID=A0ABW5VGP2_9FLAO|nr:hypothetical protein [Arenibacter sp. H213]MCM4169722.1 hypothetical protein [Arenibacter sp. H213]
MSRQGNEFFNTHKVAIKATDHIIGLDIFRRRLEKDFYANVTISDYDLKEGEANLSIEINCNFTLSESLEYLLNPVPHSTLGPKSHSRKTTLFLKAYSDLRKVNTTAIDISELTISLTDTNILISKIYEQSICEQIENITTELCHHNIYYTKGLSETPFEIFIPIFEEVALKADNIPIVNPIDTNNKNNYFIYWGVYYNNAEETAIYDLQSQKIIHGDIQILNE